MFNRYGRFPQLPFWAKVGEIPSSYKVAMSYEEQLLWLCHEIERIETSSGNLDYNALENKPRINGIELKGNLTLDYLGIQQKLRAGNGIIIDGNIISATGGGSGGTDDYDLLKHKPQINGVTLQGNKTFRELGLDTINKYTELTEYVDDIYFESFEQTETFIGDEIPAPEEFINSKVMIIKISDIPVPKFRVTGSSVSQIWFTCTDNPLLEGSILTSVGTSGTPQSPVHYTETELTINPPSNAEYIVFNFTDTNTYPPSVEYITETIEGEGTTNYNVLENKPQINGITLVGNKSWQDLGLTVSKSYTELTNYVDDYYYPNFFDEGIFIGDELPQPESFINSCFMVLDVQDLPSTSFRVSGSSITEIWFTCSDNPTLNTSILLSSSATGSPAEPIHYTDTELTIDVPTGANFIVFNFTDTLTYPPKVEVITESLSGIEVNNLTSNLIIPASEELNLETGFYNTNIYNVYIGSQTSSNLLCSPTTLFYFDKNNQEFITPFESLYFEINTWNRMQNGYIENEVTNSRNKIPTSQAVYNALQNIEPSGDVFYTELDSNITLNADGTTTPELTTGYYYLKPAYNISYIKNGGSSETTSAFSGSLFYYDSSTKNLHLIFDELNYYTKFDLSFLTDHWIKNEQNITQYITNTTGNYSSLVTSIPASGNNNDVPTTDAIRNYVDTKISRYADFKISQDTTFTTTSAWKTETAPLELITNNIQDLISYDTSTHTFTALKACKLKVELNSGINFTTGTAGSPYFAVLRIKLTSGGNTTYIGSSIVLIGDVANSNSLINTIQLNVGDTFTYEIQVADAGTYRILGGRTYAIFSEML